MGSRGLLMSGVPMIAVLLLGGCGTDGSAQKLQNVAYEGMADQNQMQQIAVPPRAAAVPAEQPEAAVPPSGSVAYRTPEVPRASLILPAAPQSPGTGVTLGSRYPCGLVIKIRGPLAKVQRGYRTYWISISRLKTITSVNQCVE